MVKLKVPTSGKNGVVEIIEVNDSAKVSNGGAKVAGQPERAVVPQADTISVESLE